MVFSFVQAAGAVNLGVKVLVELQLHLLLRSGVYGKHPFTVMNNSLFPAGLKRFCPFWGVFFCVFFVFFMSLEPIYIVAHHQMWHFPSSLATLSHICFADINNLDRSIRSPPRCGVAIVQVHRVLVVGRDWQGLLSGWV